MEIDQQSSKSCTEVSGNLNYEYFCEPHTISLFPFLLKCKPMQVFNSKFRVEFEFWFQTRTQNIFELEFKRKNRKSKYFRVFFSLSFGLEIDNTKYTKKFRVFSSFMILSPVMHWLT